MSVGLVRVLPVDECVESLCPCVNDDEPWKNHGKYVTCVSQALDEMVDVGYLAEEDKDTYMSSAAKSDCGKKKKSRLLRGPY